MLILTRRVGEMLMLGGDVKLRILGAVEGERARIGISAPRDVVIDRLEVREKKLAQEDLDAPARKLVRPAV